MTHHLLYYAYTASGKETEHQLLMRRVTFYSAREHNGRGFGEGSGQRDECGCELFMVSTREKKPAHQLILTNATE